MGRDDVEVRAFALIFQAARFERFLVGLVDVVVVVVLEQNVPREGTTTFITFITTPACVDCEGLELQQTFPAAAAPAAAEGFATDFHYEPKTFGDKVALKLVKGGEWL